MTEPDIICHDCLRWHPPPKCKRDWSKPCRCCEGPRGPGSEAGEDVCSKCYSASIVPTGLFERMCREVREKQGAP